MDEELIGLVRHRPHAPAPRRRPVGAAARGGTSSGSDTEASSRSESDRAAAAVKREPRPRRRRRPRPRPSQRAAEGGQAPGAEGAHPDGADGAGEAGVESEPEPDAAGAVVPVARAAADPDRGACFFCDFSRAPAQGAMRQMRETFATGVASNMAPHELAGALHGLFTSVVYEPLRAAGKAIPAYTRESFLAHITQQHVTCRPMITWEMTSIMHRMVRTQAEAMDAKREEEGAMGPATFSNGDVRALTTLMTTLQRLIAPSRLNDREHDVAAALAATDTVASRALRIEPRRAPAAPGPWQLIGDPAV